MLHPLSGVYAAVVTPLQPDYSPDLEGIPILLDFLARRGCHGALLLGTTGEGPSFSPQERSRILQAAVSIRHTYPHFRLLAGTGAPSLEETIDLTRAAFDLELDGVVVLPPYYYRKITDDGLFAWFSNLLPRAVPEDGLLLGYHIPSITGIPLSIDLLARLKDAFPTRFAGIKDSSGDPEHARQLGARFGSDLLVLTGNDRLFSLALDSHASGCITAMANLLSPELRLVWDSHQAGQPDLPAQARLAEARSILDRYPPMPAVIKALLARCHNLPHWPVRPPLLPLPARLIDTAQAEFTAIVNA
jgi:4-hydroxy-tetrahydrodipicolinate synthase